MYVYFMRFFSTGVAYALNTVLTCHSNTHWQDFTLGHFKNNMTPLALSTLPPPPLPRLPEPRTRDPEAWGPCAGDEAIRDTSGPITVQDMLVSRGSTRRGLQERKDSGGFGFLFEQIFAKTSFRSRTIFRLQQIIYEVEFVSLDQNY